MNIKSETVEYTAGDSVCRGYLAVDSDTDARRPGVIVIHEWWGLNDYIRSRADQLAVAGYCALAIDMYGNGTTADNPDQAGEAMNAVLGDIEAATTRMRAGYETLLAQPLVDERRTAAIGYCMGGAMALHMARIGLPLQVVGSFHGALGSFHKPDPGSVKASILVCHGEDDAMVSMDDVQAFRQEMDAAEADYEVIVHPGAGHGFSNPAADEKNAKYGLPVGYNADADKVSWDALMAKFDAKL